MTTNHVDFEVLCALAASGDLTKAERARLSDHVQQCVLCHNRLLEMRQLGIRLFLAQALKTPTRRLPRGMQERFSARAISEGIPLSSRSQGVGFSALGLVTALLVVLLMVAATLRDGWFRRSVAEKDVADTPHVSQVLRQEIRSPEGVSKHSREYERAGEVTDLHPRSSLIYQPCKVASSPSRRIPETPGCAHIPYRQR